MSNFFGNLIERHRNQATSSYANPPVEPRPKARFETDSDLALASVQDAELSIFENLNADDMSIVGQQPTLHAARSNPSLSVQSTISDSITNREMFRRNQAIETTREMFSEVDSSEQIGDITASSPDEVLAKELPIADWGKKEIQKQTFTKEEYTGDYYGKHHSSEIPDDLELQINAILTRQSALDLNLKSLDDVHSINQKVRLLAGQKDAASTHSEDLSNSPVKKTEASSSRLNSHTAAQSSSSVVKVPEANSGGLLTIPNWLAVMQSGINQRWQNVNEKIEAAKPIVNITIGTIEVRAEQGPATPSSKPYKRAQNKPSGVMSLNDYLKSRDKEGRV